jgi:hypothetical protein
MLLQHTDLSSDPPGIQVPLREIAYARSGDKGIHANVGVIARTPIGFEILKRELTPARVARFFGADGVSGVERYELPNLGAVNFVLHGILVNNLKSDAQGKALGQRLLDMAVELTARELDGARGEPPKQTLGDTSGV